MKKRFLLATAAVMVVMLACNPPLQTDNPPPTVTRVSEGTPVATIPPIPDDVRPPGFAAFPEIMVALPAAYEGYALPVDLGALVNRDRFEFSGSQGAYLSENGFYVSPADWDEFFQLYEANRYADMPTFVTTDSVYHVYHLIFSKMLRDLEREHFAVDIAALTRACVGAAEDLYGELAGTDMEDTARRVLAYFAVADNLISPDDAVIPSPATDLVEGELALIAAHQGLTESLIFSENCPAECDACDADPPQECLDRPCMCEDYSQYVPRGHYTRSELLERYFRVMMWYGRINMRLQKPDETRMALLITYILRNTTVGDEPAADVWARVYDPTAFIVGKADDLSFYEYGGLWDSVFSTYATPQNLADDSLLVPFRQTASHLPPPQVNSMWVYIWENEEQATQGFRFMGQRFTLDAYIFEQLVWREVGEPGSERWLPKGLDVLAALGSTEALEILEQLGETDYTNYTTQMDKVRQEIGALELDSWTQNLYWFWLYGLHPLLSSKGEQYPAFMRTEAWARKDLQTALGSWTELKHDTILYAKQVMAEMGGGGPPELPNGWVEPNPEAYARLLGLTRMTHDGLNNRGLLSENTDANLTRLDELLTFLLDVSQKELNGQPLTEEEYERIHFFGGELEAITLAAADPEEGEGNPRFDEDDQAAVVADVATDPNGFVLEEGTGRIFEIFVVVPDGAGGLQVARGGVYSYYEFSWPMSDRLTDEAWRAMLADGTAPAQPAWTESFITE